LNNHQGMYPLRVYVWDAKRHGVKVMPPHVNRSEIEWSLQNGAIQAGLNIVKGLSGGTMRAIIEQRQLAKFRDLDDLRRRVKFRRPELQNLIHVGACDGLGRTRPALLSRLRFALPALEQPLLFDIYQEHSIASELCRASVPARHDVKPCDDHSALPCAVMSLRGAQRRSNLNAQNESLLPCAPNDVRLCGDARPARSVESLPDYDRVAKLRAELDVTGIPFCMHPAVLLPHRLSTGEPFAPRTTATRLHGCVGKRVTVAGFVATARRARTNDNRVMGFVTLEDATGLVEASFFPDQLALYKTICSYGGPVWITGRVTEHLASLSVDCTACGRMG
jgi:DNA polymerase III alpha subunit